MELNRRLAQFKWVLDLDNIAVSVKPLVAFLAPMSLEIQTVSLRYGTWGRRVSVS